MSGAVAGIPGRVLPRTSRCPCPTVLTLAALLYYLLVLLVSRRWSRGYLADGRSADLQDLRTVALMTHWKEDPGLRLVLLHPSGNSAAFLLAQKRTGAIDAADGWTHDESLDRAALPTPQRADPPLSGVPGHVVVIGDSRHATGLLIYRLEIVR